MGKSSTSSTKGTSGKSSTSSTKGTSGTISSELSGGMNSNLDGGVLGKISSYVPLSEVLIAYSSNLLPAYSTGLTNMNPIPAPYYLGDLELIDSDLMKKLNRNSPYMNPYMSEYNPSTLYKSKS